MQIHWTKWFPSEFVYDCQHVFTTKTKYIVSCLTKDQIDKVRQHAFVHGPGVKNRQQRLQSVIDRKLDKTKLVHAVKALLHVYTDGVIWHKEHYLDSCHQIKISNFIRTLIYSTFYTCTFTKVSQMQNLHLLVIYHFSLF